MPTAAPAQVRAAKASALHPQGSAAFHALLKEIGNLHDKKQADYGTDEDPFANVRGGTDWGIPASLGCCVRIGDKVRRLQAFYRKGSLANESVEDAYMDLAVYALIGLVLYREEPGLPQTVDTSDTRTCVLCHGFLFNHGSNGECPTAKAGH